MGFLTSARTALKRSRESSPTDHVRRDPKINEKDKFYPVKIGQSFNDRYTVQKRLGAGRYASVWLVEDVDTREKLALKILNSDFYNGRHQLFELEVMQRVTTCATKSTHPGRKHVAQLKDHFDLQGPTGRHVCLVMPLLGASIAEKATTGHLLRLPAPTVRRIARQMLEALDFLHNECGVIHTDIQPSNILQDLKEHSTPELEVDRQSLSASKLNDSSLQFRLNDLGIACFVDRHLTDRIQSPYLRPSEITLEAPWEPSVDIFSLGCLLYQFITGDLPFPGRARPSVSAEQDRIATLVSLFGPVPDVVLDNADRKAEFGQACLDGQDFALSLETMVEQSVSRDSSNGMTREDVDLFCDFLRRMLASDPRKREGAATLLDHQWLATS